MASFFFPSGTGATGCSPLSQLLHPTLLVAAGSLLMGQPLPCSLQARGQETRKSGSWMGKKKSSPNYSLINLNVLLPKTSAGSRDPSHRAQAAPAPKRSRGKPCVGRAGTSRAPPHCSPAPLFLHFKVPQKRRLSKTSVSAQSGIPLLVCAGFQLRPL